MITAILLTLAGLVLLGWSADKFIGGAAAVAALLGISPTLIGLTIVAIGSSAPEMLVGVIAASEGAGDIVVGNVIGSNITNIALVLGCSALIAPLTTDNAILKREIPQLLLVTLLAAGLLVDGHLDQLDGTILFVGLAVFMIWLIRQGMQQSKSGKAPEVDMPDPMQPKQAWFWLVAGMILLPMGSKMLVSGAVDLARLAGLSELLIGLTIIAIGTSLPELAAAVSSARKGHGEMAIGAVVGSNIFNILAVLGIPGLISPSNVASEAIYRDLPAMVGLTLLLALFLMHGRHRQQLSRRQGALLLSLFIGYMTLLGFQSVS
ncbi:calcium/sodium antiporter [Pelagibaculum spongiae]|uniref:Calcium/sodium antiporter n=1 Tax=Pelagibaculum spongiae TaxID=2080658 RepID=A0A2V1H229_9GAMM|nr:calcium/sodium antiporter [Pelagibaculum spongiae]PVZ72593.1 calcium/sodium antiporter [Pelagibaculum spongiae]